ncbi:MAG: response regulator transcription factor [Akkermansiaceae bacterium]|nr:response regulator transcription factor [Akkermansiaceae bacterium]
MTAEDPTASRQAKRAIFIVDDHPMLRRGLSALISGESDLSVCGQAASCQEALRAIGQVKPDLAIIDLGLEGSDGLDLVKQIKALHPQVQTIVLSMHDESLYAERAIKAGARGYLTKQQLDDTVLLAIRRVLEGEIYLSEKIGARFAAKYLTGRTLKDDSPLAVLSDRELEVFRLIGQGLGTREIAARLFLSPKTIESHREHLKQKLSLASGTALVRRATHWVDTGEAS